MWIDAPGSKVALALLAALLCPMGASAVGSVGIPIGRCLVVLSDQTGLPVPDAHLADATGQRITETDADGVEPITS